MHTPRTVQRDVSGEHSGPADSILRPPASSRIHFASRRRRTLAVVLFVIGAGILGYAFVRPSGTPGSTAPQFEKVPYPVSYDLLGRGNITLTLPLMPLYLPIPAPNNVTFTSKVWYTDLGTVSSNITYTWGDVEGTQLPVLFVLSSETGNPEPGPMDGFRLHLPCKCPGVGVSVGISEPYTFAAVVYHGILNYNVWLGTPAPPLEFARFLLIDTSLRGQVYYDAVPSPDPFVNVTPPQPSDLLLVQDSIDTSVGGWAFGVGVHNVDLPVSEFHMTLERVTFDAGPLGAIGARLTSSFAWNEATDYTIQIESLTGHLNLLLRLYVDRRFGALYPVVLS